MMIEDSLQEVRLLTSVAPLGLRFWDEAFGRGVRDGLRVTASPLANPIHRTTAFINRRGTYVLRNLPGLRAIENGDGSEEFWTHLPSPKRTFHIEVVDDERRFQPCSFELEIPQRGLYNWTCGSPEETISSMIPLYSAPTRTVGGDMAVIRADLWDVRANKPAAWAVLEASFAGQRIGRGYADSLGRVVLICPYPAPTSMVFDASGVPIETTGRATNATLTQQEWLITLHAAYMPQQPIPAIPDLCTTLMQPGADIWLDATQTHAFPEILLSYGQELVVRSQDPTIPSVLLITPAA